MRTHHLLLGVVLLFVTSGPALATPSTLDLIANAPRYTVSDVALSPDGKYLAYVRQRVANDVYETPTVWLVSASGGTPRKLTQADIGSFVGAQVQWTSDGRGLSVFAYSDPFTTAKGRTQPTLRVWTYEIQTGHATSLDTGGILAQQFAWAPDGKRITIVGTPLDMRTATNMVQMMRAAFSNTGPTPKPSWPLPQQAQPSAGFHAFGRPPRPFGVGNVTLYILGDGAAKPIRIASSTQGVVPANPTWSADGHRLSIDTFGPPRPGQQIPTERVVEYDVATRTIVWRSGASCFSSAFVSPTSLAYACSVGDANATLADVFEGSSDVSRSVGLSCQSTFGAPHIATTSQGSIVAPFSDGPASRLYVKSGSAWHPLTASDQDVLAFSTAPRAREIAYAAGTSSGVSIFVIGDRPGSSPKKIATLPDASGIVGRYKTEEVHWTSEQGHVLNGLVVLPHDDPRTAPVIVDVHGGPQADWTVDPDIDADYFASLGYVVFKPNPRGSIGYGDWSFSSILGDWAVGPTSDVLAGLDSIERSGYGDRRREYLIGDSYGAYLVTWMLEHSHRFSAAEAGFGVYSLPLQFELSDAPSETLTYFGSDPYARRATLLEQSPLTHVDDLRTPLLMLAGRIDQRAPYSVTLLMFKTLAESGDQVRLIQFKSSAHGYDSGGEAYALDQEARWFERFGGAAVKGKPL